MEKEFCPSCGSEKIQLLTSLVCPTCNGTSTSTSTLVTSLDQLTTTSNSIRLYNCTMTDTPSQDPPTLTAEGLRRVVEARQAEPRSEIVLTDWVNMSLFSTLEIERDHDNVTWELFNYGRGQVIPESGRLACEHHTNIPRAGDYGLPRGWMAVVDGWRVTCNLPLDNPYIRAWAMTTVLKFKYNSKTYYELPLSDFTTGRGENLAELDCSKLGVEHVVMRENLPYSVSVSSNNYVMTRQLREYLAGEWMDRVYGVGDEAAYEAYAVRTLAQSGIPSPRDRPFLRDRSKDLRDGINRLQTIINLTPHGPQKDELTRALRLICPSTTLSLRVHLNCALRREVC